MILNLCKKRLLLRTDAVDSVTLNPQYFITPAPLLIRIDLAGNGINVKQPEPGHSCGKWRSGALLRCQQDAQHAAQGFGRAPQ